MAAPVKTKTIDVFEGAKTVAPTSEEYFRLVPKVIDRSPTTPENIAALKTFVGAIVQSGLNNSAQITIPSEILLYYGSGEDRIKKSLKIVTFDRPKTITAAEKSSQKHELHYDDLARIIFDIKNWLLEINIAGDKKLLDEPVFSNIEQLAQEPLGSRTASRLMERKNDLLESLGLVLDFLDDKESLATTLEAGSLEELLKILRLTPESAIRTSVWENYVLPLAKDFSKTEAGQEVFSLSELTIINPERKTLVKDARLAFELFLTRLGEALENTSRLPGDNSGKKLIEFLEKSEINAFGSLSKVQNSDFYISREGDLAAAAGNPDALNETDKNKIKIFLDVLDKKGAMDRILGNKELDPAIKAAQAAEEDLEGGEGTESLEEAPEKLELEDINKLAKQYREKVTKLLINHQRLNLDDNLKDYQFSDAELTQVKEYIYEKLKAYIQPDAGIEDYLAGQDFFKKPKEEQGANAELEFQNWFDEDVDKYASNILDQIVQYHDSLTSYIKSLVEDFAESVGEIDSEIPPDTEVDLGTGIDPEKLKALVAEYQKYLTESQREALKGKSNIEIWLGMNIRERREFLENLKAQGFLVGKGISQVELNNISNSLDSLILLVADYQSFIDSLTAADIEKYFGINITTLGISVKEFKDFIRPIANTRAKYLASANFGQSKDDIDAEQFQSLREALKQAGHPRRVTFVFSAPLDKVQIALDKKEDEVLDPIQMAYRKEREAFETIIQSWFILPEDQRLQIYQKLNLAPEPGLGIPPGFRATQLTAILGSGELKDARQPLWKRILRRPQPSKQALAKINQAISGEIKPTLPQRVQKALIKNPIKQATQTWNDFKNLTRAAQVGTVIMTVIPALGSWIGLAGTIIGGYVAGLPGAMLGGWAGLGFDRALGLHKYIGTPISSGGKLFSALGKGAGNAANTVLPTGTASAAPIEGASLLAPAKAATISTTTVGWTVAVVGAGVAAITSMITHGAFLTPLPTLDQGGEISPYLEINKKVEDVESFNKPADITYSISLNPKTDPATGKTYQIEIISAPTDEFSLLSNKEKNPNQADPTLPASESYDSFLASLGSLVTADPEKRVSGLTEIGKYTLAFGTNNNPKNAANLGPYDHMGVSNIFSVSFNVYLNGSLVAENQLATGSRSVCFGECPISSEGCFVFADAGKFFPFDDGGVTSQKWLDKDKANIGLAFKRAGESQRFTSLLCSGGPITLYRFPKSEKGYGGWALSTNAIGLYEISFSSVAELEYTLIHEAGHIIDFRNGSGTKDDLSWRLANETGYKGCFTYPFLNKKGSCPGGESFAEGVALYVVGTKYPFSTRPHGVNDMTGELYNWFKTNIFGGTTYSNGLPVR